MKVITIVLTICAFGIAAVCLSQTDKENSKKDIVKQMNLLNEQTKMFIQIFDLAGAGDEDRLR